MAGVLLSPGVKSSHLRGFMWSGCSVKASFLPPHFDMFPPFWHDGHCAKGNVGFGPLKGKESPDTGKYQLCCPELLQGGHLQGEG